MIDSIKVEARMNQFGCGIYDVGCESVRMFITDAGRVLPVQGRGLTAEDLMTVFAWGRIEERGEPATDDAPTEAPLGWEDEIVTAQPVNGETPTPQVVLDAREILTGIERHSNVSNETWERLTRLRKVLGE